MPRYGDSSPTSGRYQAIHTHVHQTVIDLKNGTGLLAKVPVIHDRIEVIDFGFYITTAVGAVTTGGAVRLDKVPAGNGTQVNGVTTGLVKQDLTVPTAATSTATFVSTKTIYSQISVDLNVNAVGVGEVPLDGPQTRPEALKGDCLLFTQTVQGVGAGAQDVLLWVKYRERVVA